MLNKADLQQSQDRWQLVAQYERREESERSFFDRWEKLNAIIRMAADLNFAKDANSQDEAIVWNRWNKLRELHFGSNNS